MWSLVGVLVHVLIRCILLFVYVWVVAILNTNKDTNHLCFNVSVAIDIGKALRSKDSIHTTF